MSDVLSLASYRITPYFPPTFVTALAILILGFIVLFSREGPRLSRAFALLSFSLAVWLSGFSLMYASRSAPVALFWARTSYIGIPFIPAAAYMFAVEVLGIRERRSLVLQGTVLTSIVFAALIVPSDLLFRELSHFAWGFYPRYRLFGALFLAFFVGVLGLSLWELAIHGRRLTVTHQRRRVQAFTLAFAFGYVALFDFLPAFGIELYPFGYLAILAFLALSVRAIRRYRLIDITPSFAADKIIDTMADPLIVLDRDQRIRVINGAGLEVFGYRRGDIIQQPIELLTRNRSESRDLLLAALEQRITRDAEMIFIDKDGQPVDVSVSVSHLTDRHGEPAGSVVIARDVRERKRVEGELTMVRHKLALGREQERLRLAQELHDGPLQDLHGLDFQIGELAQDPSVDGARPRLRSVRASLQQVARALRSITGELRPPALAPFGLESAIRSHAAKIGSQHTHLDLILNLDPDHQALPQPMRIALFRIFQQALSNAVQHAQAERIQIWLSLAEGEVRLEIEDNGRGFTPPTRWLELVERGHLGLVGAIERAESIDGRLDVISSPGHGTVIRATAPLPTMEASQKEPV